MLATRVNSTEPESPGNELKETRYLYIVALSQNLFAASSISRVTHVVS